MKNRIYVLTLVISLVLIVLALTVFANTAWLGGIVIGIGIYLLLGSIIKICKTNDKLKNIFICAVDLLFWLP